MCDIPCAKCILGVCDLDDSLPSLGAVGAFYSYQEVIVISIVVLTHNVWSILPWSTLEKSNSDIYDAFPNI